MTKKRRERCQRHLATERSWDEYEFDYVNYKGVEVYRCKECAIAEQKESDRLERMREHDNRLRDEAYDRWRDRLYARIEERKKRSQNELWDHVVRKELLKGVKKSHLIEIPKELLQLKRASMKLERLIKESRKKEKEKFEKAQEEKEKFEKTQQEEIERLKRPLVECKKHGPLFLKDVIKGGFSRWTGEQRYKCRQCMKDLHADYYERKKDFVAERHAEYRKNNPDKIKEMRVNYKEKKKCRLSKT